MTLIESMMVPCHKRVKTSVPDGLLGQTNSWADGAAITAAIIKQQNNDGTEAEKPALSELYLIVVPAGTVLAFYDVIRRDSDGAVFRVLGDNRDTQPPAQSSVQITKVLAERWVEE